MQDEERQGVLPRQPGAKILKVATSSWLLARSQKLRSVLKIKDNDRPHVTGTLTRPEEQLEAGQD